MYKTIVIIPCYKVDKQIFHVLKKINYKKIFRVFVIDDNCPNRTGHILKKKIINKKVKVIFTKKNLGVGGATKFGIRRAKKYRPDTIIKIDGDGQHDPSYLNKFIDLQKKNPKVYIKGYRNLQLNKTPHFRYFGNIFMTIIMRFLTNYYHLRDVVNGFISIPKIIYKNLNFKKVRNDYFFEQDLIFQVSLNKYKIKQKKISTIYKSDIKSSLNEFSVIIPFLLSYLKMFFLK